MSRSFSTLVMVCSLSASLIALPALSAEKKSSKKAEKKVVATAELKNAKGETVGTAEFSADGKGTKIHVLADKIPVGVHGIHIHENGKCEGPEFKSAGSHLHKEGQVHGLEHGDKHHEGDLQNLNVKEEGKTEADFTTMAVSAEETIGKSLVIHEKVDDQKSDPAGNSGARVACGVITKK